LGFPYQVFSLWPIARRYRIPILLDEHNIEWLRFRDLHGRLAGLGMRWVEQFAIRRAAAVSCVSIADQAGLMACYGINATVAPNGVDTAHFFPAPPNPSLRARLGIEDNHNVLLFFGPFDYLPNRRAAELLRERLLPAVVCVRPNTTLVLAGRNPPVLAPHPNLRITGPVPDLAPYLHLADIVLVPLLQGGGTRLKILEAMACGRCVISTPLGATGLDVPAGSLVTAEFDQFEAAVLRHLNDTGARLATGTAARQASLTYDWDQTLEGLVGLVRRYADGVR
jgi:glycosyltransferase involved in cell wall biosynthesis